jgi:hypothetical protein
MRHSGRRKNGHTSARGARTECSEIKTLARVVVDRPGERFLHTRALPFLDIVLEHSPLRERREDIPVLGRQRPSGDRHRPGGHVDARRV